jgi:hypothetical protein
MAGETYRSLSKRQAEPAFGLVEMVQKDPFADRVEIL